MYEIDLSGQTHALAQIAAETALQVTNGRMSLDEARRGLTTVILDILASRVSGVRDAIDGGVAAQPVLIQGLPVEPWNWDTADIVDPLILLSTIAACGYYTFSYTEQKGGRLVQDIVPIPGQERSNSNAGRVRLGWHTDDAVFKREFRAQGIALLCINNKAMSSTYYISVDELVRSLDQQVFSVLTQPRFRFATPESFRVFGGKVIYSEPRPLVSRNDQGQWEVACAEYSTRTDHHDDEAGLCLRKFRELLARKPGLEICLQPGDCLLFSNFRGLHSRDAVRGERLLKRAYFRSDLTDLRMMDTRPGAGEVFSCKDFILT